MDKSKSLHKDDVEILDNILRICLNEGRADARNLPVIKKTSDLLDEIPDIKMGEYKRFLDIIHGLGVAEVSTSRGGLGHSFILPIDPDTKRFLEAGGFHKLYRDQEEKKELDALINQKTRTDVKLSRWQLITFWLTFALAIIGAITGILALFFD